MLCDCCVTVVWHVTNLYSRVQMIWIKWNFVCAICMCAPIIKDVWHFLLTLCWCVWDWHNNIRNAFGFLFFFFFFSYLLGLLAKIKCSISSSQPDLWDCKQFAYNCRLGIFMKPHCLVSHYHCLQLVDSLIWQACDLSIAVSLSVAGEYICNSFYIFCNNAF